ncbi:hypothetical protein D9M71_437150 [compost metagenome]
MVLQYLSPRYKCTEARYVTITLAKLPCIDIVQTLVTGVSDLLRGPVGRSVIILPGQDQASREFRQCDPTPTMIGGEQRSHVYH